MHFLFLSPKHIHTHSLSLSLIYNLFFCCFLFVLLSLTFSSYLHFHISLLSLSLSLNHLIPHPSPPSLSLLLSFFFFVVIVIFPVSIRVACVSTRFHLWTLSLTNTAVVFSYRFDSPQEVAAVDWICSLQSVEFCKQVLRKKRSVSLRAKQFPSRSGIKNGINGQHCRFFPLVVDLADNGASYMKRKKN